MRGYVVAMVAVLLACAIPRAACGLERGNPSQVARQGVTLDDCLADPVGTFSRFEGFVLARPDADVAEVRKRIDAQRAEAREPGVLAALTYLRARCLYWQSMHAFQTDYEIARVRAASDEVVSAHLEAFQAAGRAARGAPESEPVARLHRRAGDALMRLASTNMWTEGLSAAVKRSVVTEFIDVAGAHADSSDILPRNAIAVDLYQRLGIEARLAEWLPDPLPEEPDALCAILKDYGTVLPADILLPVAERLAPDKAATAADVDAAGLAADVFLRAGRVERAERLYALVAQRDPRRCMDLALLWRDGRFGRTEEERRVLIARYVDWCGSVREAKWALRRLEKAGCYDDVLWALKRVRGDAGLKGNEFARWQLDAFGATALAGLGRAEEARSAYGRLIVDAAELGADHGTMRKLGRAMGRQAAIARENVAQTTTRQGSD